MRRLFAALLTAVLAAACTEGESEEGTTRDGPAIVVDLLDAVDAVEAELGDGQDYFEVTSTPQLVNVFVAVDDATAAEPYVYLDGELQEPAPVLSGASGQTFTAEAIDLRPDLVLANIGTELPDATVDALSVEGGVDGVVRYVVSARSEQGGVLDIVVGPDGTILSVDPL